MYGEALQGHVQEPEVRLRSFTGWHRPRSPGLPLVCPPIVPYDYEYEKCKHTYRLYRVNSDRALLVFAFAFAFASVSVFVFSVFVSVSISVSDSLTQTLCLRLPLPLPLPLPLESLSLSLSLSLSHERGLHGIHVGLGVLSFRSSDCIRRLLCLVSDVVPSLLCDISRPTCSHHGMAAPRGALFGVKRQLP